MTYFPRRKKRSTVKKEITLRQKLLQKKRFTIKQWKQFQKLKFIEEPLLLRDKKFKAVIYRRITIVPGAGYTRDTQLKKRLTKLVRINENEFYKNRDYEIYIKHIPTKQKRLLSTGLLQDIPILSKQPERGGAYLGGRYFNSKLKYPKKAHGKWVPVHRILSAIQKELEEFATNAETELRASIIPMKRYFHTDWHIYSDVILKGSRKVSLAYAHCVVRWIYPNQDWIGKQSIEVDLEEHPVRVDQLHKFTEQIESDLNGRLELMHPNAIEVSVMEVNGFIPITFDDSKPEKKKKRKKKK